MAMATEVLDEEQTETPTEDQPEEAAAEVQAPPTIPPEPPADAATHIREHYDQIREKERSVYALESEYLSLKEQAAGAKKDFEQADKALRNLIARGADRQLKLPLDGAGKELRKPKRIKLLVDLEGTTLKIGNEPPFEVDSDGDVLAIWNDGKVDQKVSLVPEDFEVIEWTNGDEHETAAAENNAWRTAPFAELGLTAKQNDLFEAAGVRTIGDLEDLRARMANGDYSAQWPKGVGPAKVTDIENRLIDWLDKNRDKFGEVIEQSQPENRTLWGQSIVGVPPVAEAATDSEPVIPEAAEPEAVHKNGNGKAKHRANGKAKPKAKAKKRK
jgi:hypothetical protein